MKIRTYSELIRYATFEDRYEYLKFTSGVGEDTFGFDRYLNQMFYNSSEWRKVRNQVIIRDNGMDLGVDGIPINGRVIIHHMNPLTKNDILDSTEYLMNPEYLITVSHETHNAIHYGGFENIKSKSNFEERKKGDTCPWKTK